MNLHSPSSSIDTHLLNEKNLLWNGLFSPRRIDLTHAFQRLNKSPTDALVDYDAEAHIQLVSVNKESFPKKHQSFPTLNLYQSFSSNFNSPQLSSLMSSPSECKQTPQLPPQSPLQTQSNFFLTNRSNAFSHRVLKPKKSKHNFTLQLSQIDRSSTISSSSKLRSLVQTPQTQPTERPPTSFFTIRGLSGGETSVKTPRVNVKSNKSYRVKSKMSPVAPVVPVVIPKKETVETVGEVRPTQLTERRVNLVINSERQKSAMFKLSDILETDPIKLREISRKFIPTSS